MKSTIAIVAVTTVLLATFANDADAGAHGRTAKTNAEGGITSGSAHAGTGPNGASSVRGRKVTTDGQGNASANSRGAFAGPNGGKGSRSSQSTVNADGSANRTSSMSASNSQGSVQSNGSVNRAADGTVSGQRTTAASGVNGSYNANTTYQTGQGVTRTATCTDANGQTITCPSKK